MKKFPKDIKDKRILIMGLGREGFSTYKLLRAAFPDKLLGVADGNPKIRETLREDKNITFHLGNDYLQSINKYDLVFKSPGISLKDYECSDKEKITSQTDVFMELFGRQTIGVTGTKGKSTTASLIKHILEQNGKDVILLGNIGIPAFDKISEIKKETIVVFELSAHQLEYLHHSPKVAVLLNIFPEHLDHFVNFNAYKSAKLNIAQFQHPDDTLITTETLSQDIDSKSIVVYPEKEIKLEPDKMKLKGAHNINNIKVAVRAVAPFNVPEAAAIKAAENFDPLPHRMEYIGQYRGIHFYNDSISTIPESAVAALKAIGKIDTLILGGFDRGLDYSLLADFIKKNPVKNIIFTGPAGKKMLLLFNRPSFSKTNFFEAEGLEEAFAIIKEHSAENGICLLSPAAASYDKYHNFEHRGDVFKSLAKQL